MCIYKFWKLFCITLLVVLGSHAHADETVSGKVSSIMVVASGAGAPGNADMRVSLSGAPTLCNGATDGSWAWLNIGDVAYKNMLAVMLTAQASGKTMAITSRAVPFSSGTFCQIMYASIVS